SSETSFQIRLKPGKNLGGTVVDPDGALANNVEVAWVAPGRMAFVDANARLIDNYLASPEVVIRTTSDGRFEIPPGLTEGALVAFHDKGYGQISAADFRDGAILRLTRWARVEGRIVQEKKPLAGERMTVYPLDPALRTRTTPIRWML